jgi:hypothetical protein
MEENQLPTNPEKHEDNLLEELAALTGLFNPENIWKLEEKRESLNEEEEQQPTASEPAE